ncbi:MAG: radical SAM protein [Deltaproteobacteria bacterium]|nr:radical SAM protein [Deltaproteobacteria bacterium]
MNEKSMNITSVFLSVDGEVNKHGQGNWSVFIRTAGCSARCSYCDTEYSWGKGTRMNINNILKQVDELAVGTKKVTITGGEPLEQDSEAMHELLRRLWQKDYDVTIETNGLHDMKPFFNHKYRVTFVADYKLSSSGVPADKINIKNFRGLMPGNFIKFVIADDKDFLEALTIIREDLAGRTMAKFYFSPCGGKMTGERLFAMMKDSPCVELGIGLNLQIHKFLFPGDWRDEEK